MVSVSLHEMYSLVFPQGCQPLLCLLLCFRSFNRECILCFFLPLHCSSSLQGALSVRDPLQFPWSDRDSGTSFSGVSCSLFIPLNSLFCRNIWTCQEKVLCCHCKDFCLQFSPELRLEPTWRSPTHGTSGLQSPQEPSTWPPPTKTSWGWSAVRAIWWRRPTMSSSSSSSTTEAPLPRAGAGTSGCHSDSVGVWHSLGASGANFPPDSFSPGVVGWPCFVLRGWWQLLWCWSRVTNGLTFTRKQTSALGRCG